MNENDFFSSLRKELNETQNIRFKFAIQKLIFIIGLLGLSGISLEIKNIENLKFLIYFVPFVSIMFDLYIIGENFGIRRIGNFLKYNEDVLKEERFWEFLLNIPKNKSRDFFSVQGNTFSTLIAIVLSIFFVLITIESNSGLFWDSIGFKIIWIIIVIAISCILWFWYPKILKRRLLKFKISVNKYKTSWEEILIKEKDILANGKNLKDIENEINSLYD